ncbi:hypothetical protein PtB15_11B65 [Puccinia triticina]|nr:hypothetical protein PtB15_11B65 [Puccinia triticina]
MSHSDSHRPPIQDAPSTPPLKQTPPPASDQTYTEDSKSRDQGSLSNLPETKRIDDRSRPNDLIHDKVHSLSKDWLAGIRADFLEIQELMNTNQQIAQDFSDWVEAGAASVSTQPINAHIFNPLTFCCIPGRFVAELRVESVAEAEASCVKVRGLPEYIFEHLRLFAFPSASPSGSTGIPVPVSAKNETNHCSDLLDFSLPSRPQPVHPSLPLLHLLQHRKLSRHNSNKPTGRTEAPPHSPAGVILIVSYRPISCYSLLLIGPPQSIRPSIYPIINRKELPVISQPQQQQFKHQKSHPSHHPSTSQPSNSIHSLSRSSYNTHHHLSNPTPPLRVGLPVICVARAHQPTHRHHHHHRSDSHHHSHLKQLVAIASRTEIRILELINQNHSLPFEYTRRHPHSSFSPSLGAHTRAETRPSFPSRSLDSSTTFEDRLAIKTNAELGPSYGVSDLGWGYASTASHLATGCTNGSIVIWDINHPITQDPIQRHRSLTLDHAHNRAINKITFAGPTGHWIASGGQDSLVKIWDIREGSRPTMTLTTHTDPVRQLRFFPDRTVNPFDLFVLTDSGTLSHFDLRQEKSCVTRRVAHASTGVGLDWLSDGYNSMLASAGADGIVKIWNMAESILPSTAMRTLVVGRSICGMAWRPGYSTQLAITPSSVMADLEQHGYLDYERGPSSAISSNYSDDLILNKGLSATGASSVSDVASESNHAGGGRHSEILLWDIRRPYVPEMIIRGRDGPASGNVWLSADLLLTIHKRTSAIVQHDIGQSQAKYADELPSQAMAVSKEGSLCFSMGSNNVDSRSNVGEEPGSAMVHSIDELQPPQKFEFLALNYKFEDDSFESVCEHNANLCRRVGQPELWQLWMAIKLWFTPQVSAALIVAHDMALGANGNDERAVAMAMRRVLKEESSDEGEMDYNQSGGDFESSCGRRSPSQDQASRQNSTGGSRTCSGDMRSKREESLDRSETRSPLPKTDHDQGHRPKLSLSGLALPSVLDPGELLRGGQSLNRSSSATTPKAQMRSFLNNVTSNTAVEGSADPARRRPAPLRSLAIDCDSPISSPDTEGPRRSIAHRGIERTPDGRLNPAWRRSMSKDRIAAKMHARGASFNELGSLIQAIGVGKLLSEKKGEDWKNQEEKMSVEIQMRESILKLVKNEVEFNGNVQLGVYVIGVLKGYHHAHETHEEESNHHNNNNHTKNGLRVIGIEKELLEDRFKSWGRVYLKSLTRHPSLLVVASEIKKKFSCLISKELENQSLRILKLNPTCGNCGKVLMNSVLPSHPLPSINSNSNQQSLTMMMMLNNHKKKMLLNNHQNQTNNSHRHLKCDKCQVNVLKCCFCHESIKFEPLIWCLKCGHGIHSNCLNRIKTNTTSKSTEEEADPSQNPSTHPLGLEAPQNHHPGPESMNALSRKPDSFSSSATTATVAEKRVKYQSTKFTSSISNLLVSL